MTPSRISALLPAPAARPQPPADQCSDPDQVREPARAAISAPCRISRRLGKPQYRNLIKVGGARKHPDEAMTGAERLGFHNKALINNVVISQGRPVLKAVQERPRPEFSSLCDCILIRSL
jgi:hypothetical protein